MDRLVNTAHKTEILTRVLEIGEYPSVADIHMQAFKESFLSLLGRDLVIKYYEWQTAAPNDCSPIGAFYRDELIGFCFAGDFPDTELGFIRHNTGLILTQLMKNPAIILQQSFLEKFRYVLGTAWDTIKTAARRKVQSTKRERKFGILAIAVDPKYRSAGVGRLLMAEAEKIAAEQGYKKMRLSVHPGNIRAVRFYEQSGWHRVFTGSTVWQGYMEKEIQIQHFTG